MIQYVYCANNPLKSVVADGASIGDVIAGAFMAYADNAAGGGTTLRDMYVAESSTDYNLGQTIGDVASMIGGVAEALSGGTSLAAEGAVTVASGGVAAVAAVPAAAGSAALVVHGASTAGNGFANLLVQKGRVQSGTYGDLPEPANVGDGKKFTQSQKQKILDDNTKRNGGKLKSDMSGRQLDPPQQAKKGTSANMNQAEVDHVKPKSKGGSNSNSNAQVLSKEENLKKGDK